MTLTVRKIILAGAICLAFATTTRIAVASDQDDGETDAKSRSLNLTDLYVFREDWHSGNSGDAANLVFIMNTNPRSLPQQQYFFSTTALYQFNVASVSDKTSAYANGLNYQFQFQFGAPNSSNQQAITVTTIANGSTVGATVNNDG